MDRELGWVAAPDGQVLVAGECPARDADGQGCTRGVVHPLHAHQHTGLRAWLEANDGAIIRIYDAARAEELEAIETPLLAAFGLQAIASQDLVQTATGGLRTNWVYFVGWLAPAEKVAFQIRAVCFARF